MQINAKQELLKDQKAPKMETENTKELLEIQKALKVEKNVTHVAKKG